jgi:hypothetical protein
MLDILAVAALLNVAPPAFPPAPTCADVPVAADPDDYRALWEGAMSWEEFLADTERRREGWFENWVESAEIDEAIVDRARGAGGTWYLLAVAIDSCSDSVSTIPYLARLAAEVEGLELRVVKPDTGRWIMEAHPTPDGRPATPTVMLLDENFEERGCFIERPTPLQTIIIENPEALSRSEIFEFKMGWYADDEGHETVREMADVVEAASRGEIRCG